MASSTTLLAWGLLEYKDAYEHSGQLENMYDCIRWPLEWMLKCHTGPNELYVQVKYLCKRFKFHKFPGLQVKYECKPFKFHGQASKWGVSGSWVSYDLVIVAN